MKILHKGREKLNDVHPKLVALTERAAEITGSNKFNIAEGFRTRERQMQLFIEGKSKSLNSKHCYCPAEAIDIYPISTDGKSILWSKESFDVITNAFKQASKELDIPIICGTDWKQFVDRPHIELA